MPTVTVWTRKGNEHELEIRQGLSLMETIREAGMDELLALCGGVWLMRNLPRQDRSNLR
jgi:2Fe-2S ferredoxin